MDNASATSESLTKPRCGQCGRLIGQEVFICRERATDRCPCWASDLVPIKERLAGACFAFVSLLILASWIGKGLKFRGCGFFLLIVPLAFIGIGLYLALHTRVMVYDRRSGVKWKRESLLGIPLAHTLVSAKEPVLDDLILSQPLTLPPSVLGLPDTTVSLNRVKMEQAVVIFRATLIGLVAQGVIQAHRYQVHVARWGGAFKRREDILVFSVRAGRGRSDVDSVLERDVIAALARLTEEETAEWPDGVPIYELARSVYQRDVESPPSWLIRLVARDATAHGWGRFKGIGLVERFELDAACAKQFVAEWSIVSGLLLRLVREQPDLSGMLNVEIERAIKSRKKPRVKVSGGISG
jgi:hypothetical protein